MFYFFVVLSVGILLLIVKKQETKRQQRRKQIVMLAEQMLNKQIEILGKGDYQQVSMELEIAKYLKDCIILRISEGEYEPGDIRKAHKWLRDEFEEGFQRIL